MQYDRLEDKPYIEAILPPLVEAKVEEWKTGSPPNATTIYNVAATVRPAGRSNLPFAKQVDLDGIEVGGTI
jgi:hypothetical protein